MYDLVISIELKGAFVNPFQLPVKIDIIKHPHETDGKSTAVHAKLIAPDDVTVYTYPCIPEYENERDYVRFFLPTTYTVKLFK